MNGEPDDYRIFKINNEKMKAGIKTNFMGQIQLSLLIVSCFIIGSCVNFKENKKTEELINKVENNLVPEVIIEGDSIRYFNIEERMKHHKVPGLSIALVDGGKIQWAKGYGTICFDTTLKVDENTLFQAASMSKPVAALMALKLVEEGKLALDDDVNNYVKDSGVCYLDLQILEREL